MSFQQSFSWNPNEASNNFSDDASLRPAGMTGVSQIFMIQIDIQSNPNCPESPQYVYNEIGQWAPFSAIRVLDRDGESICDVVGVDAQGQFINPKYIKINDSAEGTVYLLYGGDWGIRLRPRKYSTEAWDLNNAHQWGEPFKIYGDEKDIL